MIFSAHGFDKSIDPYYEHLYEVNVNGSNFVLTPGNYDNNFYLGDRGYFVNNYSSKYNTKIKSDRYEWKYHNEFRNWDLSALFEAGYNFPEPFKAKANDGITDIYGVIYKPFDFDETRKYPLIQYVYPGPQTEGVNKSFTAGYRWNRK